MKIGAYRIVARAACALLVILVTTGCKRDASISAAPAIVRVAEVAPASPAKGAPISLTTSDGAGLELVGMHAESVVQAPLAFTELQLTFRNPEDRVREGRFEVQLPPGATISRFAMKIAGRWQEGEVVEKKLATRAYEDFLHRRQDPALLEQAAGNSFSARVFPIPAQATKELVIGYSQEVGRERKVLIPLAGLPAIQDAVVRVSDGSGLSAAQTVTWSGRAPAGDIALDATGFGEADAVRAGGTVAARVRLPIDPEPEPWTNTVVLVDTSASRGLGLASQVTLVEQLIRRIAQQSPDSRVDVACFDQTVERMYLGRAADFGAAELERIRARGALGASNLDLALRWSAESAKQNQMTRVVMVTDGVATAGPIEGKALVDAAGKLRDAGVQRLDAVVVGGIRDEQGLKRLVTAGLPRDGAVVDGAQDMAATAARLEQRCRGKVPVEVKNATWWWPQELAGAQAGDEVVVFADLPEGEPLVIAVGGKQVSVAKLAAAEQRLLSRSWAKAKIDSLIDKEAKDGRSDQLRDEITSLSVKHRVLSPYTALLVLETEQDYQRYDLDRKSLSEILTVRDGRVVTVDRAAPTPTPAETSVSAAKGGGKGSGSRAEPADEPSAGENGSPTAVPGLAAPPPGNPLESGDVPTGALDDIAGGGSGVGAGGGLRLGGGGGQGFGGGSGRLGGSHRTSPPQVRYGVATVEGGLDTVVVQRAVRRSFGQVRQCYEQGLSRNSNIEGTVALRFRIESSGRTSNVATTGSRLGDQTVVTCIRDVFRRLEFPPPEKKPVKVFFELKLNNPGGGDSSPSSPEPTVAEPREELPKIDPYDGEFAKVMQALAGKKLDEALQLSRAWHDKEPGDVLALTALGTALHASDDWRSAMRAYGSLIDLYPFRADLRRFAGERLELIGTPEALALASDTYEKAREQRPDHPASHRLLAFALARHQEYERAFDVLEKALKITFPSGRFRGADRILKEDLGLIAAAWIRAEPKRRAEIERRLDAAGGTKEDAPSLRFVLNWETDANDVDFHIYDAEGHHAYYQNMQLDAQSELYADVTTGYGPECFTIRKPRAQRSSEYKMYAHYYSRGPMGYGMGMLQIIEHDGKGDLTLEERPFVIMRDRAFVDLGTVKR